MKVPKSHNLTNSIRANTLVGELDSIQEAAARCRINPSSLASARSKVRGEGGDLPYVAGERELEVLLGDEGIADTNGTSEEATFFTTRELDLLEIILSEEDQPDVDPREKQALYLKLQLVMEA